VIAEDVTHILAQEAFNALPKFLNPIHIFLVHFPIGAGAGLERRDFLCSRGNSTRHCGFRPNAFPSLARDSPEGVRFLCLPRKRPRKRPIVSENYQATREPMHFFLGAVAQIEKHLALRIRFP